MSEGLQEVLNSLEALKDDRDLGKKVKEKTELVISILKNNKALAIEKAMIELEELNSYEISSYHRTQVWDIISLLESINR